MNRAFIGRVADVLAVVSALMLGLFPGSANAQAGGLDANIQVADSRSSY